MKWYIPIIGIVCFCLGLFVSNNNLITPMINEDSFYNGSINRTFNGLYNHNGKYYCVWLDNVSINHILNTEVHEQCHALVDADYCHFCVYGARTLSDSEKLC